MPSWWMPDSWRKAFAPTIALWGCTAMPVYWATNLEVGVIVVESTAVRRPSPFNFKAQTTSSRAAFPARSPMPLIVHSIWRAPIRAPAKEFAVAKPKSFWQCVEKTRSRSWNLVTRRSNKEPNSQGMFQPVVSGIFIVVAPASATAAMTRSRNSGSLRPASSGENSTSSQPRSLAKVTAFTAVSTTSSGVFRNLLFMCTSDVAMKVWIRGYRASFTASQARWMSFVFARLSPQITGT
mmetsp:Transcript_11809/g.38876  ORF Transcript_11809/g.38876 Transcript_11809/m.38876 type:complete len:237 (+) Transcript_11809:770-1480(+)